MAASSQEETRREPPSLPDREVQDALGTLPVPPTACRKRRDRGSTGGRAIVPLRHPGARRRRVAQIDAHITGTVWKVEVAVGDRVDEGDTVVILESMKMEMPVEAEDEGTVKAILVEEGQSVSEGDPLVELE
jgi:acetyl-CoA carboxylase biotin carboxyl carrier protein